MMGTAKFADFALELARAARLETLPRWADCCPAEDKGADAFDPVTEADREAERVIRTLIQERFPEHGITGEEWPDKPGNGPFTWSLDPVDGTRSFMCRLPTWVTLIALLQDGAPVVGVIDAPCLDETYVGFGGNSWMIWKGDRTPLRTSDCTSLAHARFSATEPSLDAIRRTVRVTRFGYDGYAYARLAGGTIDLVIESGLKPHDYNALIPVIRGAGGHVGDWSGGEDFGPGAVVAAATRELYEEAVGLLARTE
jgi:histidinol phosphatase-like enzyme (inositol monophosphatase family)